MLLKNQVHTIRITDMNNLGYGISHIDGQAIFVSGGITDDLLEIKLIKVAKDYAVGRLEKILSPSLYRIESECPVSGRCGGCSFRNITREYELELKRNFVVSAFKKNRIDAKVNPVLTDGKTEGYRNKVQYPVSPGGSYGYYARHSHTIITSDTCLLSDSEFTPIAAFTSEYIKKSEAKVKHIYLRRGQATGEIMLCLVSSKKSLPKEKEFVKEAVLRFPSIKSIILNYNPEETNVILGREIRILFGGDVIEDILCDCRFEISSLSFYQVNRGAAEILYNEAIKRAAEDSPKSIADLYCGAGTIGISFAKAHPEISVIGVEIIPDAVKNAIRNAEINGIKNAEFICDDALKAPLDGFDCIITDPPRKGMSSELIERIAALKPKHIVYVSCEPTTLARDASKLIDAGYKMSDVTPVDMFPGTGSVECVTDFRI